MVWGKALESRRKKRKRADDDSSSVTSVTDETGVLSLAPSRSGNRIQITSEREPCELLASGMQQVNNVFWPNGGATRETGEDELASCDLQYSTSVFHGAHPQATMGLSEEPGTAKQRRVSRRFACW